MLISLKPQQLAIFLPVQRISNLAAFSTMPIEIGNITEPVFVSLPVYTHSVFFVDMHNYVPLLTTISRIFVSFLSLHIIITV